MNVINRKSGPFSKARQVSLAQALDITEQSGNLTARRLRDLRSAVNTLARLRDRYSRTALSRFIKYCSALGLKPADVDDDISARYLQDLTERSLIKQPRSIHQTVCRVWNRVADSVEGWPRAHLTVPNYRALHFSLPWSGFPASLETDVEAWLTRLGGDDLLSLDGPIRPVKASTVKKRRDEIRRFASALVQRGVSPEGLRVLSDLVSLEHFTEGLRFYLERNDGNTSSHLHQIAHCMLAVAKHHVRVEGKVLAELKHITARLKPEGRGLSEKNRRLMAQFNDHDNLMALMCLPQLLERSASGQSYMDALKMQWAVAIEILLMAPMRISNLAELDMERHLVWSQAGMKGTLSLMIPDDEVKNEVDLAFKLPDESTDLIRRYITGFRPVLNEHGGSWLFPGKNPGQSKRSDTLSKQVKRAIRLNAGLAVHAHLMRHIAGHLILTDSPGNFEEVRRVLAHKSLQTTVNAYIFESEVTARERYDHLVLKLRHGSDGEG